LPRSGGDNLEFGRPGELRALGQARGSPAAAGRRETGSRWCARFRSRPPLVAAGRSGVDVVKVAGDLVEVPRTR